MSSDAQYSLPVGMRNPPIRGQFLPKYNRTQTMHRIRRHLAARFLVPALALFLACDDSDLLPENGVVS